MGKLIRRVIYIGLIFTHTKFVVAATTDHKLPIVQAALQHCMVHETARELFEFITHDPMIDTPTQELLCNRLATILKTLTIQEGDLPAVRCAGEGYSMILPETSSSKSDRTFKQQVAELIFQIISNKVLYDCLAQQQAELCSMRSKALVVALVYDTILAYSLSRELFAPLSPTWSCAVALCVLIHGTIAMTHHQITQLQKELNIARPIDQYDTLLDRMLFFFADDNQAWTNTQTLNLFALYKITENWQTLGELQRRLRNLREAALAIGVTIDYKLLILDETLRKMH